MAGFEGSPCCLLATCKANPKQSWGDVDVDAVGVDAVDAFWVFDHFFVEMCGSGGFMFYVSQIACDVHTLPPPGFF